MGLMGCGIMLAGLLSGALFGGINIALVTVGIGALLIIGKLVQEKQKEKQAQAWRKNYPSYRY